MDEGQKYKDKAQKLEFGANATWPLCPHLEGKVAVKLQQ